MLDKWKGLSGRERFIITVLFVIVGIWLVYQLICLPLYDLNKSSYNKIESTNRFISLLDEMQGSPLLSRVSSNGSLQLLPTTQQVLQQAHISSSVTKVDQVNSKAIELTFKGVVVADYMQWLQHMLSSYPVAISSLHMSRVSSGVADIDVALLMH
jgi:type II secretory pathway component PulM